MDKKPLLTLEEGKSKIASINWNKYLRDFENDSSRLQEIFWKVIATDMLSFRDDDWKTFPDRFYRSFSGTFVRINALYVNLQSALSGVSRYEWNEKSDMRSGWEEQLSKVISSELIVLHENIINYYDLGKIKVIPPETILLQQFDHYHKQLDQPVSAFLLYHVKSNPPSDLDPALEDLPVYIKMDKSIVPEMHSRGMNILKANATRSILKNIGQYFETQDEVHHDTPEWQKPHTASQKANRPVFAGYIKVSGPKEAYENLVHSRPKCAKLSTKALTDIIKMKYRDKNGRELQTDSISKAIRRIRRA